MGGGASTQVQGILQAECARPADCSDITENDARAEVIRLRKLLHDNADIAVEEEQGLKVVFELFDEDKKGGLTVAQCCKAYLSLLKRETSEAALIAEIVALGYKEDEVKKAVTLEMFVTLFENHKAEPTERASISFQAMSHGHGDKGINADDIMQELGPRATFGGQYLDGQSVKELISEVTHSESGVIMERDFAELKKKLNERKSLVEAFNVYDKDGDGEVSLGDLYQTMLSNGESVTLDEVKEMLNECDLHHNGYINFEDFRKAMGSDVIEDDGAEA
mmetsp:Transcript_36874/g.85176  ORF Transcript_36874/g.85176 Transcript_36874/m.85176 type:complete len:278 (+) Transcript_36874:74-907(+)